MLQASSDLINHSLEVWWCIHPSFKHNQRLKDSIFATESCLPLITRSNACLVICPSHVQFSEVCSTTHLLGLLMQVGKGIPVRNQNLILKTEVMAEPKLVSLMLKENGMSSGGCRAPSGAITQTLIH